MVSVPFEDCRAKVENAREHIALVERRIDAFLHDKPQVRLQTSGFLTAVNFGPAEATPKPVSLAVGDAIHNMRSALDMMAGDAVQQAGHSRKGVYFPFAEDERHLDIQIKNKHFDRAGEEAIAFIKTLKPYKGGNTALRALHDLDITDKHNFVIPTGRSYTIKEFSFGGVRMTDVQTSGSGRNDITIGGHPIGLDFGLVKTELIFAPGKPLAGEKVIPTLHSLCKLTSGIIEAFVALFGGDGHPFRGSPTG